MKEIAFDFIIIMINYMDDKIIAFKGNFLKFDFFGFINNSCPDLPINNSNIYFGI
jgi:hypothetical protein